MQYIVQSRRLDNETRTRHHATNSDDDHPYFYTGVDDWYNDHMDVTLHRCVYCGELREPACFKYIRTTGLLCKTCLCQITGYETIEEWERDNWNMGDSSPRGA